MARHSHARRLMCCLSDIDLFIYIIYIYICIRVLQVACMSYIYIYIYISGVYRLLEEFFAGL